MKSVGRKQSVNSKRILPPAARLDSEAKTIEKKLEELKAALGKKSDAGRKAPEQPPGSKLS